jgi:hypothetical protein
MGQTLGVFENPKGLCEAALKLCCHLRQFPNVQDFSAANGSNVLSVEREQGNRPALSSHKLDLEGRAIAVTVHHCPYVTLFQTILANVMRKDDCI